MLTDDEVQDLFTYNNTKRCLGIEFEIYDANMNVISTTDELYRVLQLGSRTDFSIDLDTDTAPQDGTVVELEYPFKIKAINAGGAFGWKDVVFKITICGYEVLDVVSETRQDYQMFIVNADIAEAENYNLR
jgi:hypothetical protein